jgi:hypothetical protein
LKKLIEANATNDKKQTITNDNKFDEKEGKRLVTPHHTP